MNPGRLAWFFAAVLTALPMTHAQAQRGGEWSPGPRSTGIGAILGDPWGFSAAYWLDSKTAYDFALGSDGDDLKLHADLLIRLTTRLPENGPSLPFYIGLGGVLASKKDTLLGVRFVGGLSHFVQQHPVELFIEFAPVLRVAPSFGSNLDAGLGLRYYFRAP